MATIRNRVGRGQVNQRDDVILVQTLINQQINRIAPLAPLKVDGLVGDRTINAIMKYQQVVVGLRQPDGRVDPGGKTIQALQGIAGPGYGYPPGVQPVPTPGPPGGITAPKADVGSLQLKVERFESSSNSMIGKLYLQGKFLCYTLEEAWRNNARGNSCVPSGTYNAYLRYTSLKSQREWCFELTNVPNRTAIQIHIGNDPSHTEGCILVGLTHGPDNVGRSVDAYQQLQDEIFGAGFTRQQIRDAQPKHGVITVQFTDPIGGPTTQL